MFSRIVGLIVRLFVACRLAARSVLDLLIEFLFPLQCLGCEAELTLMCDECLQAIPVRDYASGKEGELDKLIVATDFEAVQNYIHVFKYGFVTGLAEPLAQVILKRINGLEGDYILMPVPLHARRLRERGFNQSELLAVQVSRVKGWPLSTSLARKRYTKPQAELSRKKRLTNLKEAFYLKAPVAGRQVILIDDVYTTGATMNECARALRSGGAASVYGLVLARG